MPSEALIRLASFAGVFAVMALLELLAPRRAQAVSRWNRWPANIGIVVIDTLAVRLLFPTAAVGVALAGEAQGWGLLNVIALPTWLEVMAAVVLLDLAIYFQHVLFHTVPVLWRLHRMHHADLEFDVTTGLRFHQVEVVLSMVIKFAVVAALGAPAIAVIIFEVLLNATSMFNHSNIRMPAGFERALRWLVVTPEMQDRRPAAADRRLVANTGLAGAPNDRQLVLVCRTDRRSAKAAEALRAAGYRHLAVLRGGMGSWNASGLP